MRARLLVFLAILLFAKTASAGVREEVAAAHAPIFLQEVKDPIKDLFAAYDFDGNWNGDDNAENMECWADAAKCVTGDNPGGACAGQKCPLVATVYFTTIETDTHWFVQYMPYHPLDFKVTNGHEHDTESVLVIVRKDGTKTGFVEAMETRFHTVWYQYAGTQAVKNGADDVDGPVHFDAASGRPLVHVQMVGHGFCGGYAPRNDLFPDLQLTCTHADTPHFATQGVRYSPDLAASMPIAQEGKSVDAGYALVELATSMWTHIHEIGAGKAFGAAIDFNGERCGVLACPRGFGGNFQGNEGQSPGEPWAQAGGTGVGADGDQFFDPAYTMGKRFTFSSPFALDYCFNPYLSIADRCAGSALDAGADASPSRPSDDAGASDAGARGPSGGVPIDAGGEYGDEGDAPAAAGARCGCIVGAHHAGPSGLSVVGLGGMLALRRRRGKIGRT